MDQAESLCNGRYLRLVRRGHWEYAERVNASGAVIIVAVTPQDKVVFVEQFRIPLGQPTIEMPAGLVGDQEGEDTIERAAIRELEEETGWRARHVDFLCQGPTSAGMSNEVVAFVRARGLQRVGAGGGDDSEQITVHEVPCEEAAAWLSARAAAGYAIDAKLYAGLYFIHRNADGTAAG
ncbi:MAG TPA: NUDIX hydrolase [Xanthomonadaceae bacterium]|nr:NUDIX hydrolase [Xanthomonadaceae bacterium]